MSDATLLRQFIEAQGSRYQMDDDIAFFFWQGRGKPKINAYLLIVLHERIYNGSAGLFDDEDAARDGIQRLAADLALMDEAAVAAEVKAGRLHDCGQANPLVVQTAEGPVALDDEVLHLSVDASGRLHLADDPKRAAQMGRQQFIDEAPGEFGAEAYDTLKRDLPEATFNQLMRGDWIAEEGIQADSPRFTDTHTPTDWSLEVTYDSSGDDAFAPTEEHLESLRPQIKEAVERDIEAMEELGLTDEEVQDQRAAELDQRAEVSLWCNPSGVGAHPHLVAEVCPICNLCPEHCKGHKSRKKE